MDIRLDKMIIKNFKVIKSLVLDLGGINAFVYGDNGKGKTTLKDAYHWCLFGKDSQNRAEGVKGGFDIKTFKPGTNEPVHNLDHEVEAHLSVDGKPMKVRRLYAEKWVRKHGESQKELTGHTTKYWIDDEPLSQKEFQERINAVIPEGIFRLLTNPDYFNAVLAWKERRKILFGLIPGMTDLEVIQSDPKLVKLADLLGGKSMDGFRNILNEKLGKLEDQRLEIPIKINELNNTMLGNKDIDYTATEAGLADFKAQLNAVEQELAGTSDTTNKLREKRQKLFQLERNIETRKKELEKHANAGNEKLLAEKQQLELKLAELKNGQTVREANLEFKQIEIDGLNSEMDTLRDRYKEVFAANFITPDESDFTCPTCQRQLPMDDIEQQIKEMETNFNSDKQQKLAKLIPRASSKKERKEMLADEMAGLGDKIAGADANIREINERLAEIAKELNQVEDPQVNYVADKEYCLLAQEMSNIRAELDKSAEDIGTELLQKKQEITTHIEDLNRVLNQRETDQKAKARIEQLMAEEKRISNQISELEGQKYLLDQFVRRKVSLTEGDINGKFNNVRFQMFEILQNGALVECCNTLVQSDNGSWVDWTTNGNTAAKTNSGLEIINTLSRHYGVTAPVFLDNRESIRNLVKTDSQIINLVVSDDQELRIEVV